MRNLIILLAGFLFFACEEESGLLEATDDSEGRSYYDLISETPNHDDLPGYFIVVFNDEIKREIKAVENPTERLGLTREWTSVVLGANSRATGGHEVNYYFSNSIVGFAGKLTPERRSRLALDERIKYIEQDRAISLGYQNQIEGMILRSKRVPYGITRVNGGKEFDTENKVFIIDTGVEAEHEDLNVDIELGYSSFPYGLDRFPGMDRNGHGTHVAGTVGAIDNNIGVIGVVPGIKIVPVKVLKNVGGYGSYGSIISGVDYAAGMAETGDVANMSLGGRGSVALDEAIEEAANTGLRFSLAAGNDAMDVSDVSPARVNHENVFTISAIDDNDRFAYFSNYGDAVDFSLPGVGVLSTYKCNSYGVLHGTSMAAPHFAGLLILNNYKIGGKSVGDPDLQEDPIPVNQ